MTTLREAVKAVLVGDATLTALATGGVHDMDSVGHEGLTRKTLMVSGQVEIRPGIYIVWSSVVPFGKAQATIRANRVFFEVYFYQDTGFDVCEQMRKRVKELLNYQTVTPNEPADEWCHQFIWAGDVVGVRDDRMSASMERSRYQAIVTEGVN